MCDGEMDARAKKRAREAERYQWLKTHGYCVKCGSEKAFGGRVCCADCLYKMQMRAIQYAESSPDAEERRKRHNARQAEWARQRRARRKAAGICVCCGKREALEAGHGANDAPIWSVREGGRHTAGSMRTIRYSRNDQHRSQSHIR